jgi:polyisoprenoid-binding protein YceI
MNLHKTGSALLAALALALAAQSANAQPPPPPQPRPAPVRIPPSKDPMAAPAAPYKLDPTHTAVILRILHEGSSYSMFRFNTVSGMLNWDPARIETSKVEIMVDPASITTPAPGFVQTLIGPNYLNVAVYPEIRFVSTGIHRTGPMSGDITGDLTLLGKTRPIVIHAEMVGVGHSVRLGTPTVGFSGSTKFKRSDFGLTTLIPGVGDECEILIESSFDIAK